MSVEVKDGGLNWKARIDTSDFDKDRDHLIDGIAKMNAKQKQAEQNIRSAIGKNLQGTLRNAREEFASLSPEIRRSGLLLSNLSTEIRNVQAAEKKLSAAFNQGKITQNQYSKESAALAGERRRIAEVIRQETLAMSENERMSRMQNGSIDQKRAKLAQMTRQWNALSEAERKNAQTGGVLQRQIRSLDREVSKLDRSMRSARGGGMVLNQVLMATAGIFTLSEGSRLIRDIIKVRGEIEQLEVAFSTMLGSKEKADQLMAEIVEVATTTPFKLTEVADATKQLLAYGFAQKEIKPELIAIGNIASGVGATFQEVAYAYGTLKTQGRAFARDIRQFTTRGIPIVAELAKQFETTEANISKMVSAGEIGFEDVQKAFQSMTGAGGMFFNLMEKQSNTVTGQIAKLQDQIQLMFNEIGKGNDGLIKSGISGLSFLVENYKSVIDTLGALVVAYGSYRAALIATAAAQAASGASAIAWTRILVSLKTAIQGLNAAMVTSPLGAFTAVFTALGLAAYSVSQTINTAKSIQENYNESLNKGETAAIKEKNAIHDLIGVLNSQNTTRDQQESALESLRRMMGDHLKGYTDEEIAAGKAMGAIHSYTGAIKENIAAKEAYDKFTDLNKQLAELDAKGIDAIGTFERVGEQIRNTFDPTRDISISDWWDQFISRERSNEVIVDQAIKSIKEQKDALLEQFDFKDELTGNDKPVSPTTRLFETLVEDVTKNFDELNKLIENKADAEKIKENLQNVLEGLAPDDSQISGVKTQLQKINQVLESYSLKNENKDIKDQSKEQQKILEDINKMEAKAAKRSHERNQQEVESIKAKYEAIRQAIRDAGFGKKEGAAIITRVDNIQQADIENLDYRTETEELKKELATRKTLYENYEKHITDFGVKSANERYGTELGVFRTYLEKIQSEYDKLANIAPENRTGVEEERFQFLKEGLDKEKILYETQYNDLLKRTQDYEQKRNILVETYQREREKILLSGDTEYLAQFDKQFNETILALNREAFKDNSGYTTFFENIEFSSKKAALNGIKVLKDELLKLSKLSIEEGGISPEDFTRINAELDNTSFNIRNEIVPVMNQWASTINDIAGSVGSANKGFALMLKTTSELISRTAQVKTNIEAYKQAQKANDGEGDTLGMINAGAGIIGAVVGAIGAVTNAIDSMQKANLEYRRHILDLQYAQFNGELEINRLHRDRALIDAEGNENTLDSLTKQSKVLSDNAAKIEADYQRIFGEITGGVNEKTLEKINKELSTQGINKYNKLLQQIEQSVAISGTKTVKKGGVAGFFGGVETVNTYESLAGKSFEELLGYYEKGQLVGRAKELFEELRKLKEEGEDVNAKIDELNRSFANIFTGGLEWSGMADGIIAEFQGAGSQIEDILKNAILNGFKIRFLQEPLNKLIDEFAADAQSDDELTQSEISKFTHAYTALTENAKTALSQLEESTGITLGDKPVEQVKGLPATIRRDMTEASASELSGLFRSFYDLTKIGNTTAFEHMKIGQRQADSLIAIQLNTYNTVGRLDLAVLELKAINKNTKGGQTGRDLGM